MEVLNYREQAPGAYGIAMFDIDFGSKWGMKLVNWKLCKAKKSGNYYISGPSYKAGKRHDGSDDWKQHVEFYGDKGKEFEAAVLELLKPYIEGPGRNDESSIPF